LTNSNEISQSVELAMREPARGHMDQRVQPGPGVIWVQPSYGCAVRRLLMVGLASPFSGLPGRTRPYTWGSWWLA